MPNLGASTWRRSQRASFRIEIDVRDQSVLRGAGQTLYGEVGLDAQDVEIGVVMQNASVVPSIAARIGRRALMCGASERSLCIDRASFDHSLIRVAEASTAHGLRVVLRHCAKPATHRRARTEPRTSLGRLEARPHGAGVHVIGEAPATANARRKKVSESGESSGEK